MLPLRRNIINICASEPDCKTKIKQFILLFDKTQSDRRTVAEFPPRLSYFAKNLGESNR